MAVCAGGMRFDPKKANTRRLAIDAADNSAQRSSIEQSHDRLIDRRHWLLTRPATGSRETSAATCKISLPGDPDPASLAGFDPNCVEQYVQIAPRGRSLF